MMTILLINTAMAWEIQTTTNGAEYHWPQMPVDYVWVADDAPELSALSQAIDGAFGTWTEVPNAEISVSRRAHGQQAGEVALDDDHVVFFERNWPTGNEALAIATTWTDESGQVVSFDIRINARSNWSTTGEENGFDLQAAITHEVGHVLGLEHSGIGDATMFASHDVGEDWRQVLHEDDEGAVQYLYQPRDSEVGPVNGCSTSVGGTFLGWLTLVPLTLILRRRR